MFIYHNDKQKMIKNRNQLSSENQFLELVAALENVIFQKFGKNS